MKGILKGHVKWIFILQLLLALQFWYHLDTNLINLDYFEKYLFDIQQIIAFSSLTWLSNIGVITEIFKWGKANWWA